MIFTVADLYEIKPLTTRRRWNLDYDRNDAPVYTPSLQRYECRLTTYTRQHDFLGAFSRNEKVTLRLSNMEVEGYIRSVDTTWDGAALAEFTATGAPRNTQRSFWVDDPYKQIPPADLAEYRRNLHKWYEKIFIKGHGDKTPVGITSGQQVTRPALPSATKGATVKVKNKFYVAAPSVTRQGDTWAKPSLAEAIKHAEQMLKDEPNKDEIYIVKIIRRVRRKPQPVIVDTVE